MADFLDLEVDEARFATELARSRRRRRLFLLGAAAVVVAVVLWRVLSGGESDDGGGFVFEPDAGTDDEVAESLSVPDEVDARLVDRIDLPVVVREGNAETFERIVEDPPDRVLPVVPGDVVIGLTRSGEEGRVVITGPDGWRNGVCVVASITSGLVPLDVIRWGGPDACPGSAPGRPATERCRSPQTLVLAIDVPQGEVELPTGGTGRAEALRVQVLHRREGFAMASVRGRVDVSDDAVDVPVLSGPPGETAEFVLGGAGARVRCQFR